MLRNTVLAVLRTTESDSTDKTPIAFSISSCVVRGLPRARVRGESAAERFQILFVFRAELFFWRDQRSWKFRVSDRAIKGRPSSREDNTPEYDAARDRMNSVSQRNQTGNAGDYQ